MKNRNFGKNRHKCAGQIFCLQRFIRRFHQQQRTVLPFIWHWNRTGHWFLSRHVLLVRGWVSVKTQLSVDRVIQPLPSRESRGIWRSHHCQAFLLAIPLLLLLLLLHLATIPLPSCAVLPLDSSCTNRDKNKYYYQYHQVLVDKNKSMVPKIKK